MKQKPIIPRELANRDVDNAITYYLEEQAEKAALEKERKASAERRRKQFDNLRREKPVPDPTEVRTLSRAQKLKLRDDDFVAPRE